MFFLYGPVTKLGCIVIGNRTSFVWCVELFTLSMFMDLCVYSKDFFWWADSITSHVSYCEIFEGMISYKWNFTLSRGFGFLHLNGPSIIGVSGDFWP